MPGHTSPNDSTGSSRHGSLWLRLVPLLLWAAALAYLSLAPSVKVPSAAFSWDKLNHAAAYAVLAFLLIRVLLISKLATVRLLAAAWFVCFSYGAVLEGLQWLMGMGRQWEWGDLLANAIGALVVCVVFRLAAERFLPLDDRRSP